MLQLPQFRIIWCDILIILNYQRHLAVNILISTGYTFDIYRNFQNMETILTLKIVNEWQGNFALKSSHTELLEHSKTKTVSQTHM